MIVNNRKALVLGFAVLIACIFVRSTEFIIMACILIAIGIIIENDDE